MMEYTKTYGQRVYTILDKTAYERYWWGRKASNRKLVGEWLENPDASMHEVAARHGKYSPAIQAHITALKQRGILRRSNGVIPIHRSTVK